MSQSVIHPVEGPSAQTYCGSPTPLPKGGWSKSETTPALLRRFRASRTCVLRMFLLLGGNRAIYQNCRDRGISGFGIDFIQQAKARQLDNVISENIPRMRVTGLSVVLVGSARISTPTFDA